MDRVLFETLLLFVLLGGSALLAGAEAAYFSLTRLRYRHLLEEESPRGRLFARLLANPHDLLVTLLVGITLVNIAASAVATSVATALLGRQGLGVAIAGMIFLLVVFGEVLPMTLAVDHPQRFGAVAGRPVLLLAVVLTPIRRLLGLFTALATRAVTPEETRQAAITEAELRTLVDVGHREGVVERGEREMIHKVFELGETTVGEIMVPRTDVFAVEVSTPPERLLEALRAHPHQRVPVFEGTMDNVIGVLSTKQLLPYVQGLPPDFNLRALLQPPSFVPETKRADALLKEFRARKRQMAIVVDEYGGTAGLVTLEDILEELVGEIADEFDVEERLYQQLDPRTYRVSAKMPITDFSALLGLPIPDVAFDTVGGWVLDLFGRVPHRGETVEAGPVRVTVEKVHRTRILEVQVALTEPDAGGGE